MGGNRSEEGNSKEGERTEERSTENTPRDGAVLFHTVAGSRQTQPCPARLVPCNSRLYHFCLVPGVSSQLLALIHTIVQTFSCLRFF